MARSKMLVHTLKSSGSGRGISYWKLGMTCPRKANIQRLHGSVPRKPALLIGSAVHALLEIYYSIGKERALALDTKAVQLRYDTGETVEEQCWNEAERYFRAYRMKFDPGELGEVQGVEIPVKATLCDSLKYTARIDLLVKANRNTAKRWQATRQIDAEPGYWNVDHKTDSEMRGDWGDDAYRHEVQFTGQMVALTQSAINKSLGIKVKGTLVNVIGKGRGGPNFHTVVVPYPSDDDIAVLETFLRVASIMRQLDTPLVTSCYMYGPCDYIDICTRR